MAQHKRGIGHNNSGSDLTMAGEVTVIAKIKQQSGIFKLIDLADIDGITVTAPTDDQCLAYDTATGVFINQTISGGGGSHASTHAYNSTDPFYHDLCLLSMRPNTGSALISLMCHDRAGTLQHTILQPEYDNYADLGTGTLRLRKIYVVGVGSSSYYVTSGYFGAVYLNTNGPLTGSAGSYITGVPEIRIPTGGYLYAPVTISNHAYIIPATSNYGYVGMSGYYFYTVYANYVYYKVLGAFDALDDLGMIKRMKTHPTKKDRAGRAVIDEDTIPDEIRAFEPEERRDHTGKMTETVGYKPFIDAGALSGLLLGAVKQLLEKVEKLEEKIAKMESS